MSSPNYLIIMIILGLNHGEINSSVALIKDGKVLAGAPEERFSRNKRTKSFLRTAGRKLAAPDRVS